MKKVRRGKPAEVIGAENDAVAAIVQTLDAAQVEFVQPVAAIVPPSKWRP